MKPCGTFDLGETLFIICSKTFTTLETLTNARAARAWCLQALGDEKAVSKHFVAVSTNAEEVAKFGIDLDNMFGFWDWVGGRYSMDSASACPRCWQSAPSTSVRCSQASTPWTRTSGARRSDQNLPVLLGLLAIWNNNFLGAPTVAVLPYEQYLKRFPAYLQQLTMESNGKHVTLDGTRVNYDDRPDLLGRAWHQRPAFVLPVDSSRHAR